MSRNLEGQWINFLIGYRYFKGGASICQGGQMPPAPPKRNPVNGNKFLYIASHATLIELYLNFLSITDSRLYMCVVTLFL